jgi:hypothetical protein
MSYLIRSRRQIAATLALIVFLTIAGLRIGPTAKASPTALSRTVTSQARVPTHHRPVHRRRKRRPICPINWHKGPAAVERLIRCAALHWHVPGGPQTAISIAWRESRMRPNAYNLSGAEGIYQHMRQYWPKRAAIYGYAHASAFNARANIMVTMQMVQAGGWGPWGF